MNCVLEILFPNCDKNVSLDAFVLSLTSREPHGKYYRRINCRVQIIADKLQKLQKKYT